MPDTPPPAPETIRPKRRWWHWVAWSFVALVVLAAIFHRPLLRWGLDYAAQKYAQSTGLELHWDLSGSVISDLALKDIRANGPLVPGVGAVIRSGNVSAKYSLWNAIRGRLSQVLDKIEMVDADVHLDLRNPVPAKEKPPTEPTPGFPDVWVKHVHLQNINVHVQTPEGDLVLRGFTLMLDEGQPGEIKLAELRLPNGATKLVNVQGKTLLEDHQLTIEELAIQPGLVLSRLKLDLRKLSAGAAAVEIAAQIGQATLAAQMNGADLKQNPEVEGKVSLTRLDQNDLKQWVTLPEGVEALLESLEITLKGPVKDAAKLQANIVAVASGIRTKGFAGDRLELAAALKDGRAEVSVLRLQAKTNVLNATANALLPSSWAEAGRSTGEVKFQIQAPALQAMVPALAGPEGKMQAEGVIQFSEKKLTAGQLKAHGEQLQAGKMPVMSLDADVTTDAKEIVVKALALRLDEQNAVNVTVNMGVDGAQATDLAWKAELRDLTRLLASAGVTSVPLEGGEVMSAGTAKFTVAEIKTGNFTKATASAQIQVQKLKWKTHELGGALVEASLSNNKVALQKCEVKLDERNQLQATGSMDLQGERPLALSWTLALTDLAAAWQWADRPDIPPPDAGTVVSEGTVKATVDDLQQRRLEEMTAETSLVVGGLKIRDAVCESLQVKAAVSAGRVTLQTLALRINEANKLTASGHLTLDEAQPFEGALDLKLERLADLSAWLALAKAPKILEGKLLANWQGGGTLANREVKGGGVLQVDGLRLETMADPATLTVEVKHEGRIAEISKIAGSSGRFRVDGNAWLSDTELRVPRLVVLSDAEPLVDVVANVPLALSRVPRPAVPIDEKRPIDVRVHVAELESARLFGLLGRKPVVEGSAALEINLQGMLADLKGSVLLDVKKLKRTGEDRLEPASVHLEAKLAGQQLTVDLNALQPPLKPLVVKASLPVKLDEVMATPAKLLDAPLEARVTLEKCDLALVKRFVPIITDVRGSVDLDVQISGPVQAPQWKGALRADVPLVMLDNRYTDNARDVKAYLAFEGQKITVEEIAATVAGGKARITGKIDVTQLANPVFDLKVDAADALIVRDDAVSMRANADVKITGALAKADVSGRIELVRGRVFKEIEFLPLSLPNQLPPPPPPSRINKAKTSLPKPFDQWTFNVKVVNGDPIRLLGNVLNGAAVVDIHAGGDGGGPKLKGKVSLQGAKLRLPFSTLDVTKGDIIFHEENPFEPELDIQGDSVINNYQVSLFITGSAFKPKTRFISSPPLSEADIATLVATGTTASDAGSAEGVAASRAAFLVLSQLYRKAFKKPVLTRRVDEPPRLTFGFSAFETRTEGRSVTATYQISPKVQAVGAVGDRGSFRGMLYYLIRFR